MDSGVYDKTNLISNKNSTFELWLSHASSIIIGICEASEIVDCCEEGVIRLYSGNLGMRENKVDW